MHDAALGDFASNRLPGETGDFTITGPHPVPGRRTSAGIGLAPTPIAGYNYVRYCEEPGKSREIRTG